MWETDHIQCRKVIQQKELIVKYFKYKNIFSSIMMLYPLLVRKTATK